MKIWFDTEFIEDGKTIDLLSIGMVRDNGSTFYLENAEADHSKASPWVRENVLPHLRKDCGLWAVSRDQMRRGIVEFVGVNPEFWAYYGAYDWVALCQLFGTMMDLPKGWPKFVRDVKQFCADCGDPRLPEQTSAKHDALADAIWTKEAWEFLRKKQEEANGDALYEAFLRGLSAGEEG